MRRSGDPGFGKSSEHGKAEREGFPRARGAATEDVLAGEGVGNRGFLDREGGRDALFVKDADNIAGEAEVGESIHREEV